MKFSLSTLLLVIALSALALGWWCDHKQLSAENDRLNIEAAEWMNRWIMSDHSSGFATPVNMSSQTTPGGSYFYDFRTPEDRADYLEAYQRSFHAR